jgi:hypothetical protein
MNMRREILIGTMTGLCLALVSGCAGSSSSAGGGASSAPTVLPTVTPSGTTPTIQSGTGVAQFAGQAGYAVAFQPDSAQALSNYVGSGYTLNAPANFALHVNLSNDGSGYYSGSLNITYQDNGVWRTSSQSTGTGSVQYSLNNWYNGLAMEAFNQWFTYGNTTVFHGFFQDSIGAVILVLDKTDAGTGDGLTSGTYSGSVWYKTFYNPAGASQSSSACWFITAGPFDCQTFLVNGKVQTTSAVYPSDGYQRLGTFTGLNVKAAFNQ